MSQEVQEITPIKDTIINDQINTVINNPKNHPRVGIGVIIKKDNKLLFGKRIASHNANTWTPPGGHLEFYEELEQCARRETAEEAGIQIKNIHLAGITNDFFEKEKKHYVTIYFIADHDSGDPQVMEPDKVEKWQWFSKEELPQPLFLSTANLFKQGFNPFDK